MAKKTYRMLYSWNQVVSAPNDPVYLTETRRRGDLVDLDENSEDARRLLAADPPAIVEKGKEPDDLKAELDPKNTSNDVLFASSSGSGQTSSAEVPPGEEKKARLHTSTPN
jgi:hypothetical protein